jgi:hypothetical protein
LHRLLHQHFLWFLHIINLVSQTCGLNKLHFLVLSLLPAIGLVVVSPSFGVTSSSNMVKAPFGGASWSLNLYFSLCSSNFQAWLSTKGLALEADILLYLSIAMVSYVSKQCKNHIMQQKIECTTHVCLNKVRCTHSTHIIIDRGTAWWCIANLLQAPTPSTKGSLDHIATALEWSCHVVQCDEGRSEG